MELMEYCPSRPTNANIEKMMEFMLYRNLRYRLSELVLEDAEEIDESRLALQRAFAACKASGVDIGQNFRSLYIGSRKGLVKDWLLSSFARNLILLNMNPKYPRVARLQTTLLLNHENIQQTIVL